MRTWITRLGVGVAAALAFAFFFIPVHTGTSSVALTYVELAPSGAPAPGVANLALGGIPPNCATWSEIYPNPGAIYHQDVYVDNGDGVLSACDLIKLSGMDFHVVWAGPTYHLSWQDPTGGPQTGLFEPGDVYSGENPVCETWTQIAPDFGPQFHVDSFHDNGDGVVSICDFIDTEIPGTPDTTFYHIDEIGQNLILEPGPTPTKITTWGLLKQQFKN